MALTPEGLEELEELKKLRERQLSAEGIEPTPLTKSEQNLHADSDKSKKPLSPEKSKEPLEETANQTQAGSLSKKLSAFFSTPTLEEKLHSYFSSEEGRTQVEKMRALREIIYPNEIKLNGEENLVDQLEKEGVDLDLFDKKILKLARPLNRDNPHYVKITLPDNRFLTLDIFQYERDKAQRESPPPGPQDSNQEQSAKGPQERKGILRRPADSYFAERNSENQESRIEENTPTDIPNYLPTPLFGFEPAFQASKNKKQPVAEGPPLGPQESNQEKPANGPQNTGEILKNANPKPPSPKKGVVFGEDVKEKDGKKGKWGEWISATTQRSTDGNSNNGRRGSR